MVTCKFYGNMRGDNSLEKEKDLKDRLKKDRVFKIKNAQAWFTPGTIRSSLRYRKDCSDYREEGIRLAEEKT
jgi:hypothetical protein